MEALLIGKRKNNKHRSSTITIFAITNKATTIKTFQMDVFCTIVSFGNQIKKGHT